MKVRLLKKLRRKGRSQVHIHSVFKENGNITGMSIGFDAPKYGTLFCIGDTEEDVKKKAEHVYIKDYIQSKKEVGNAR